MFGASLRQHGHRPSKCRLRGCLQTGASSKARLCCQRYRPPKMQNAQNTKKTPHPAYITYPTACRRAQNAFQNTHFRIEHVTGIRIPDSACCWVIIKQSRLLVSNAAHSCVASSWRGLIPVVASKPRLHCRRALAGHTTTHGQVVSWRPTPDVPAWTACPMLQRRWRKLASLVRASALPWPDAL